MTALWPRLPPRKPQRAPSPRDRGDLYIEGETIRQIGSNLNMDADRTVDAAGKYILPRRGLKQMLHTKVLEFTDKGVLVETDGEQKLIAADTCVYSMGMKADKAVVEEIRGA